MRVRTSVQSMMVCLEQPKHLWKYLRLATALAVIFVAAFSHAQQSQPKATAPAGTRKAAPRKATADNSGMIGVQAGNSDLSWLQDMLKNKELMADLNKFGEKLKATVQYPAARNQSKILPRLPESTLFYVALPNYGETFHQALQAFQEELKESAPLRDFLQKNKLDAMEPKIENGVQKFYELSQYLGEEIVLTGKMEGKEPSFVLVAEVKKPGVKEFLEKINTEIFTDKTDRMHIVEPQGLAASDASFGKAPIALVRPDLLIIGFSAASLREFSAQIDQGGPKLVANPMGQRVSQAYQGGTNSVFGVDLHKVIGLIPQTKPQDREMLEKTGFADAKYLVSENTMSAGRSANQMELAFNGPRHGIASWVAAPAPMGGLDFVSAKAAMAADIILKSPAQIFDDVVDMAPPGTFANLGQMEAQLNMNLKQDLLSKLSGEIAIEMQMPFMPAGPASGKQATPQGPGPFKVILGVLDPAGLQQTLARLLMMAPMQSGKREEDGVTFYTLSSPSAGGKTTEINYFFLDNYLVFASDAATATDAVRQHRKGESLGNSSKLREALGPNQPANASMMMYQNAGQMLGPMMAQMPAEIRELMPTEKIDAKPNVYYIYGDKTSFRGTTSNNVNVDVSMAVMMAAIAIPNMLRSRIAANEAAAAATVRTMNTAQLTYKTTYPSKGYAPSLAVMGPPPSGNCTTVTAAHACLLDDVIGNASCAAGKWCTKGGYRYSVRGICSATGCSSYVVTATPVSASTGQKSFCSTLGAVVRVSTGPPLNDPLTAAQCKAWKPME